MNECCYYFIPFKAFSSYTRKRRISQGNMKYIMLFLLFTTLLWYAKATLLIHDEKPQVVQGDCSPKDIIQKLFRFSVILIIKNDESNQNELEDVVKEVILSKKYSFEQYTCGNGVLEFNTTHHFLQYRQYIIYAASSEELHLLLDNCFSLRWYTSSRFLIITHSSANVEMMLNILKKKYIYKALIFVNRKEGFIFYTPKSRCSELENDHVQSISTCISKRSLIRYMWRNIIHCNLRIGLRLVAPYDVKDKIDHFVGHRNSNNNYSGIELMFVSEILDKFETEEIEDNFTIKDTSFIKQEAAAIASNFDNTNVDIIMGAISLGKKSPEIAASYPLIYENLVAVVKKDETQSFLGVFSVFTLEVWLFIFIINAIYVYSIWTIQSSTRDQNLSIGSILLLMLSILLGKVSPLKNPSLRLIFLSWIWLAFVLRISFKALMIFFLTKKDVVDQVDQLQTLCDNNYMIFISNANYAQFHEGFQISNCYISKHNFILHNDPLKALLECDNEFVAAFVFERNYFYNLYKFIDNSGKIPFHVVKEKIYMVPLSFYFRRGDPLLEVVEMRGFLLYETGIIYFCKKLTDLVMMIRINKKLLLNKMSLAILLKHLMFIFYIYLMGVLLSVIVFICEIVYHKCCKRTVV